MDGPIKFIWTDDGTFVPASRWWAKRADIEFAVGEEVELQRWEDRSWKSHGHQFAWLKNAWDNLPDFMVDQFPSPEHLRKYALIKTGYCSMRQYPCGSAAEATRWAINLRPENPYCIVKAEGSIVTVYEAMSQSVKVMGAKDFQASKQAILDYVASLLRVEPGVLAAQSA